jgi:hypothetical protein
VKNFTNDEMAAPNVMRVPIDLDSTTESEWLRRMAASEADRRKLYWQSPAWRSDIRWYSARSQSQFARFRSIFEQLGIARHVVPYVDVADEVRLYNSFLVIRSECTQADFHADWANANNEGFTLLTPLTANCSGFGLLYRKLDGSIGEYEYKQGEALIFGDDFIHSTKPGISDEPVVLLCFNFGSDKMEHWPRIERTAARQGILICRPDGQFYRRPIVTRLRNAVGRALRKSGLRRPAPASSPY